jgi:hypothetical protein
MRQASSEYDTVSDWNSVRMTPIRSTTYIRGQIRSLRPSAATPGRRGEAPRAAGRDSTEIERALNVMGLNGAPATGADQLARNCAAHRLSTLLVGVPQEDPVS